MCGGMFRLHLVCLRCFYGTEGGGKNDFPVSRGEFESIGKKVENDFFEFFPVVFHRKGGVRQLQAEIDTPVLGNGLEIIV